MRHFLLLLSLLTAISATSSHAEEAPSNTELENQARELVRQFAGQLKPQLMQAMQQGGPVNAISVCADQAPKIAADLSAASGWQVKRVSLKPRNDSSAIADDWETSVLQSFEAQLAKGADPQSLEQSSNSESQFRFIKAQLTAPLCLNCHGKTLAPAVEQALQKHYPNDLATGYEAGQVRGGISLVFEKKAVINDVDK